MSDPQILAANIDGAYLLRLVGDVRLTLSTTLDNYADAMVGDPLFHSLVVDLCETDNLDSTTLGMLAKLALRVEADKHLQPDLYSCRAGISRLIRSMGFAQLFVIHEEHCLETLATSELKGDLGSEKEVHAKVLDAHKTLMSLSAENEERFRDLLNALEAVQ
jgi:anti-anti-sigma regulatory factor